MGQQLYGQACKKENHKAPGPVLLQPHQVKDHECSYKKQVGSYTFCMNRFWNIIACYGNPGQAGRKQKQSKENQILADHLPSER